MKGNENTARRSHPNLPPYGKGLTVSREVSPIQPNPHFKDFVPLDRLAHWERQLLRWAISRYQPRPNISKFIPRRGHVSARNAGAKASPAELPPTRPSRPGMTHHHGRGKRPLSIAWNGTSTCSHLSIGFTFHKGVKCHAWQSQLLSSTIAPLFSWASRRSASAR